MDRLRGKVVLITGAAMGIGRAAAELFAREGARVAVADINAAAGEETTRRIQQAGGESIFLPTDVTSEESVAQAIAQTVRTYGGLNVLFNNVGGSTSRDGPVTDAPIDEFWRTIKVDLFGTWLCCRLGIPELIKAGGGSVVNMSSVCALMGLPGLDAYTSAKGGISALTRSMAVEFAPHRVRVNAIAPTRTTTERVVQSATAKNVSERAAAMNLLGSAEPIDIAYAALYLASDESRITTGQVFAIDSGITIS